VVDHGLTLGPVGTGIEGLGKVAVNSLLFFVESDGPVGVNNGSHEFLGVSKGDSLEFVVGSSDPVRARVAVDLLDVSAEVKRLLREKEGVDALLLAKSKVLARFLSRGVADKLRSIVGHHVCQFRVKRVKLLEHLNITIGVEIDGNLAHVADVVLLGVELVGGGGNGGNRGEKEGSHTK
jgi:hypothetical protein